LCADHDTYPAVALAHLHRLTLHEVQKFTKMGFRLVGGEGLHEADPMGNPDFRKNR